MCILPKDTKIKNISNPICFIQGSFLYLPWDILNLPASVLKNHALAASWSSETLYKFFNGLV
jgi:hypothetical protein